MIRDVILVAVFVAAGQVLGFGCANTLKNVDELSNPADDGALKRCRNLGRAALDAGSSNYRAFDVYEECTREAGLR